MLFLGFLGLTFILTTTHSSPVAPRAEENYRLPFGAVEVESYIIDLTLENDVFDTNNFAGKTLIKFQNLNGTDIKIHANGINFTSVILTDVESDVTIHLQNENFVPNKVTDILVLTPETQLVAGGIYTLGFSYKASLRTNEMYGFYKSSYVTSDNERRYLATTQFQPTHARKVFPCFDEPFYKAKFDISITHPLGFNAISNTAGHRSDSEGKSTTTFATTPVMSTYLIAFVVSDFTCTAGVEVEPHIPYEVCSRDEAAKTRELAVDVGPKLIEAMRNFTGISYGESTLNKLHQFAIPDFSAGAMENWGLVTYRETALLWDQDESSNRYKQRVESVVAHEFAHFWFGDLVTTHWWSDTFLNEGFATYFEYFATADVEQNWEMDKQFVLEQIHSVLVSDSSPQSQALSSAASSPSQVSGRFSSISYNKGGTIFRMVSHVMGLDNFKKGINKYLTENKFQCTTPEHLWNALDEFATPAAINLDAALPVVMRNWVYNPGYPVLNVKLNGSNITIQQSRFLNSGNPRAEEQWFVPISYTVSDESNKFKNTSPRVWLLPNRTLTLASVNLTSERWIILNNQQSGYFRVNYDSTLLGRIEKALSKPGFDGIHVLNRAQIVDDFYNFVRFGNDHTYSQFFNLLLFLKHDNSFYTWTAAINAFNSMLVRVGNPQLFTALSNHILDLMNVAYNSVPFDSPKNDDQVYTHTRVLINTWACRLGLQNCIDHALTAFANYRKTSQRPDKNLRSVIYCNGLRHSKAPTDDWKFLWEEYIKSDLATEQVTLLSSLGCASDEQVILDYLSKSIVANSSIRQQDALSVFSSVYTNSPNGVNIALTFLIENYNRIAYYYGSMNSLLNLFSGLSARFNTNEQIARFEKFISESDLDESIKNSASGYINSAKNNLKITETLEKELSSYFSLGESPAGAASTLHFGPAIVFLTLLVQLLR